MIQRTSQRAAFLSRSRKHWPKRNAGPFLTNRVIRAFQLRSGTHVTAAHGSKPGGAFGYRSSAREQHFWIFFHFVRTLPFTIELERTLLLSNTTGPLLSHTKTSRTLPNCPFGRAVPFLNFFLRLSCGWCPFCELHKIFLTNRLSHSNSSAPRDLPNPP